MAKGGFAGFAGFATRKACALSCCKWRQVPGGCPRPHVSKLLVMTRDQIPNDRRTGRTIMENVRELTSSYVSRYLLPALSYILSIEYRTNPPPAIAQSATLVVARFTAIGHLSRLDPLCSALDLTRTNFFLSLRALRFQDQLYWPHCWCDESELHLRKTFLFVSSHTNCNNELPVFPLGVRA